MLDGAYKDTDAYHCLPGYRLIDGFGFAIAADMTALRIERRANDLMASPRH